MCERVSNIHIMYVHVGGRYSREENVKFIALRLINFFSMQKFNFAHRCQKLLIVVVVVYVRIDIKKISLHAEEFN